jgi:hypothetical protein
MALPVLTTLVRNSSSVSLTLVKHAKIEKASLTDVFDNSQKFPEVGTR